MDNKAATVTAATFDMATAAATASIFPKASEGARLWRARRTTFFPHMGSCTFHSKSIIASRSWRLSSHLCPQPLDGAPPARWCEPLQRHHGTRAAKATANRSQHYALAASLQWCTAVKTAHTIIIATAAMSPTHTPLFLSYLLNLRLYSSAQAAACSKRLVSISDHGDRRSPSKSSSDKKLERKVARTLAFDFSRWKPFLTCDYGINHHHSCAASAATAGAGATVQMAPDDRFLTLSASVMKSYRCYSAAARPTAAAAAAFAPELAVDSLPLPTLNTMHARAPQLRRQQQDCEFEREAVEAPQQQREDNASTTAAADTLRGNLKNSYLSSSCQALQLHPVLLQHLHNMGIKQLTDVQMSAFSAIDRGKDCVVLSRTGTGKTLAYLLPIINKVYKMHDMLLSTQFTPPVKQPLVAAATRQEHTADTTAAARYADAASAPTAPLTATAAGLRVPAAFTPEECQKSQQQQEQQMEAPATLSNRREYVASTASSFDKLSVGQMLQRQLLLRQESIALDTSSMQQRHAALPPLPQAWEQLLLSGSRLFQERQKQRHQEQRQRGAAVPDRGEEEHLSLAEQHALLEDHPLGNLRPVVLLLPSQDLVIEVLLQLQQLDPLGRLQIQCLTGVARNVAARQTQQQRRQLQQQVRLLREHFAQQKMLPQSKQVEQLPGEKSLRQSHPLPEALHQLQIRDYQHHPPAQTKDGEAVEQGGDSFFICDSNNSRSSADSDGSRSSNVRKNTSCSEKLRIQQQQQKAEKEDHLQQQQSLYVEWQGQAVRRPQLEEGGVIATEVYSFSSKKNKRVHWLRVNSSSDSSVPPASCSVQRSEEEWTTTAVANKADALMAENLTADKSTASIPQIRFNSSADESVMSKEQLKHQQMLQMGDAAVPPEDGLEELQVCRLPILHKARIRWGAVDVVICTPQLFFEDLQRFKHENLLPSLLLLDEVDTLLQARGSATLIMDILGYCRPRIPVNCPLTRNARHEIPAFKPCQVVLCAATLPSLGPSSPGVMLIERFGSALAIFTQQQHMLRQQVKQLWVRLNPASIAAAYTKSHPLWRSERADAAFFLSSSDAAAAAAALSPTAATTGSRAVLGRMKQAQSVLSTSSRLCGGNDTSVSAEERARDAGCTLAGSLFPSDNAKRKQRFHASWSHRIDVLLALLKAYPVARTVVFTNTVERCIRLYDYLRDRGWPVAAFHRKMSMRRRAQAVARLHEDGEAISENETKEFDEEESLYQREQQQQHRQEMLSPARILIATDLACRGLDLQGVQHVVNFDFPTDAVTYIHRAGRMCRTPVEAAESNTTCNKVQEQEHFFLVSNLLAEEDMRLACSLCLLQQDGRPLHSTFSRRKSFKSRYLRGNERVNSATNAERACVSSAVVDKDAEKTWKRLVSAALKREQVTKELFAAATSTTQDNIDPACISDGLVRAEQEEYTENLKRKKGASYSLRLRQKGGVGAAEDILIQKQQQQKTKICIIGRRKRTARDASTRRRHSRYTICSEKQRESKEGFPAKRKKLLGIHDAAERLLRGAIWSSDGLNACVEAPYSFYDLNAPTDERRTPLEVEGQYTADVPDIGGNLVDEYGVAEHRQTSRGEKLRRYGAASAGSSRIGTAEKEGGEQQLSSTPAAHTEEGFKKSTALSVCLREACTKFGGPPEKHMQLPEGEGKASRRRFERIRLTLLEDASSEDEDNSAKNVCAPSHGLCYPTSLAASAASAGGNCSAAAAVVYHKGKASTDDSMQLPHRWPQSAYEALVVRRFQQQQPKYRVGAARAAEAAQLQRRATELRTKMLLSNFGANEDFDEEDLKV